MPLILLADDDESLRGVLRQKLMELGYTVTEARTGAEAIRAYQRERPDAVVADIIMPETQGLEAIHALKKLDPGVKIIAMSGGGLASAGTYLDMAKAMGADRVLAKPFSTDEFVAALAGVFGRS